jgi:asparagine synthase (glutamine-hydrolysing)
VSGIAGIYHLDSRVVDRAVLRRMLDCMPNPDSDRIWTRSFVGLGHSQFATTREAVNEIQPTTNRSGTCCVTFDGRVDNREELIHRLRPALGKLTTPTDVQLLLHAYDVWGTECLKWVVGDFAFALWDSGQERMFCGRDTYGIRPFYYCFDGQTFLFGSDVRQIFEQPLIEVKVDDAKVAEWFSIAGRGYRVYRDLSRTFFQGIAELPFGHFLLVDRAGLHVRRYWEPSQIGTIRYSRMDDYLEHFSEVFRDAVRCRLRCQGPVGAELSGGLDSSSIVCMAQEIYNSGGVEGEQRLKTFSLAFDQLSCDERPRIRSVVQKYGLEPYYVIADQLCGLSNLSVLRGPDLLELNDPEQPHTQEAMEALYALAQKHGIRVMLCGEGAENHVMGSRLVFDSLVRNFKWWNLIGRVQTMPSYRARLSTTIKYAFTPVLPEPISRAHYYDWVYPELKQQFLPGWLTPGFRRTIMDEIDAQKFRLQNMPRFRTWGQQAQFEAFNPGNPILLKHIPLDSPLERRFPYHDRRLIEFCLAIPPEIKYQHLDDTGKLSVRGRILQRQGLRGILPEAIRESRDWVHFDDILKVRAEKYRKAYIRLFAPPVSPLVAEFGYVDGRRFWASLSAFFQNQGEREFDSAVWYWIDWVTKLEIWLQTLTVYQQHRSLRTNSVAHAYYV